MLKRPFLVFLSTVALMIGASIVFIQSALFARLVKNVAAKYVPSDLGVEADFSEFAIKLFPPGISVRNPKVTFRKGRIQEVPEGSTVRAARIDLNFLPFQMLTGDIRINEAVVVDGEVSVNFSRDYLAARAASQSRKARNRALKLGLKWDELLRVRLESLVLENTKVHVELAEPKVLADLTARNLRLGQWLSPAGAGFELEIALSQMSGTFPKAWSIPDSVESADARIRVNSEGVQVDRLSLMHQGVSIQAHGGIRGNLLKPTASLPAELKVQLSADLASVSSWLELEESDEADEDGGRAGRLQFKGDIKADLDRLVETVHADGILKGTELRWDGWIAQELEASGSWSSAPGGGELRVQAVKAWAPEVDRGRTTPASGGKLEVGAFRYKVGSTQPVLVPLRLDRAHLHWLIAPVAKKAFSVMLRATGPIEAKILPPEGRRQGWAVSANLDLAVQDFQLDNQRADKDRKLKRVLQVADIRLKGPVQVDSRAVKLDGLSVQMPHTQFSSSGSIEYRKGLDMKFTGPVDLVDVGSIAETPIKGRGTITTRVVGPMDRFKLIFDAELSGTSYINLNFGDFKGRVTWDDDPEHLLFDDVRVTQGKTVVTGGGVLDLSREGTINLDLPISQGTTGDLFTIFDPLTSKLSWLPRSLSGAASGRVRITGGLDLDKLKVIAQIYGFNWEYLGERFRRVSFNGGYDGGKYYIERLDAIKRSGSIHGQVSYEGRSESISWSLSTSGLTLSDLDRVASLDVPVRGSLNLGSRGNGRIGARTSIDMETEVALFDLKVRGIEMPPSELSLRSKGTRLLLLGTALAGQGRIDAAYDFNLGSPSHIKARLKDLDFSPVLLLLNPKLIQDRSLIGAISGLIELQFKSGEIERSSGNMELNRYQLAKTGAHFELERPVSARIDRGSFDFGPALIRGNRGEASLQISGKAAALDGKLGGDVDVSILEFLTPSVMRSAGTAALDFSIAGTIKSPDVFGRATVEDASLQVRSLDAPIENVSGVLQLRQNVISVSNLEGLLAGGRVSAGGTVTLFVDRVPKLALSGAIRDVKLKVFPFQFIRFRGKLGVSGTSIPYLVSGDIVADSALAKEKMMSAQATARGLKSARFQPRPVVAGEGDFPLFKLDIGVKAEKGIVIQNDLFDAEVKSDIRIVNTLESPRILGNVNLVQGRMNFKEHVFQIQSAEMEFDNPTAINPRFSLIAQSEVNNTKVNLFTSGRLESFKIELSSNPALPEQEILQLLAMGGTSSDIGRLNPGNRSMVETGSAASLALHALDVNRDLQQKTGFQVQIDDAVNTVAGNSVFQPRTDSTVTASPKIVIRRKITRKFDVSMGSTVGLGNNVQREVNAEYQVSRGVSVMGVWNSLENVDARNSLGSSFGVDVKVQKRFK